MLYPAAKDHWGNTRGKSEKGVKRYEKSMLGKLGTTIRLEKAMNWQRLPFPIHMDLTPPIFHRNNCHCTPPLFSLSTPMDMPNIAILTITGDRHAIYITHHNCAWTQQCHRYWSVFNQDHSHNDPQLHHYSSTHYRSHHHCSHHECSATTAATTTTTAGTTDAITMYTPLSDISTIIRGPSPLTHSL